MSKPQVSLELEDQHSRLRTARTLLCSHRLARLHLLVSPYDISLAAP